MPFPFYYDFFILWAGARIAQSGGNIYDHQQLTLFLKSSNIGWPENSVAWGYTYPPWAIWAYWPLGYLNFYQAAFVWFALNLILLWILIRLALKLSAHCPSTWPQLPFIIILTSTLCYLPLVKALTFGQGSLILTLGTTAFCYYFYRSNFILSGAFLSLTFLKPQLLFTLYIVLLLRAFAKKQFSLIAGIAIGFAAQIIMSLIFFSRGYQDYANYVLGSFSHSQNLSGSSLSQIFNLNFGIGNAAIPILIVGSIASIVVAGPLKNLTLRQIMYILPISLLSTPYAFLHSYSLLWPCYLSILGNSYAKSRSLPFWLLLASGLFGLFIFSSLWTREPLSCLLPIIILAGIWYFDRQTKNSVPV